MIDAAANAVLFAFAAALALTLMMVVASDVGEDVQGPTAQLLSDHHARGDDRGLFHQLRELVRVAPELRGILIAGPGDKHHVTLEMAGGLVMFPVGDLP